MSKSRAVREVVVENAVLVMKKTAKDLHVELKAGPDGYPKGLQDMPMALVSACLRGITVG